MEDKIADIEILKKNIKQILSMYEDLKEKYNELTNTNNQLQTEINQKNEIIQNLDTKIDVLKTAKTISISEEDKETVRKKN
jgi:prefoldin subunit 5